MISNDWFARLWQFTNHDRPRLEYFKLISNEYLIRVPLTDFLDEKADHGPCRFRTDSRSGEGRLPIIKNTYFLWLPLWFFVSLVLKWRTSAYTIIINKNNLNLFLFRIISSSLWHNHVMMITCYEFDFFFFGFHFKYLSFTTNHQSKHTHSYLAHVSHFKAECQVDHALRGLHWRVSSSYLSNCSKTFQFD